MERESISEVLEEYQKLSNLVYLNDFFNSLNIYGIILNEKIICLFSFKIIP